MRTAFFTGGGAAYPVGPVRRDNQMKTIFTLLLAIALGSVLGLTACGERAPKPKANATWSMRAALHDHITSAPFAGGVAMNREQPLGGFELR